MKKTLLLLCIAMTALLAVADSYFFIGNGEKVRIRPNQLYSSFEMPVSAHFDGRLDYWELEFTYPENVRIDSVQRRPGMNVPYLDRDGNPAICEPDLTVSYNKMVYSSEITEFGYWDPDNDGIFEPYGTVKWGPGDYDTMFVVYLGIEGDCTGDTITIEGDLRSTFDWRGNTENTDFVKKFALVVGYDPGDVNGDYIVTMNDLTTLTNYLLDPVSNPLSAYQFVAADMNGDGMVNMDDLTALINYLVNNQGLSLDELDEVLNGGQTT